MRADSSRKIRIAAAVILDEQGRLALVRKRGTKAFMQPGGKLEIDETPEACLRRELHEELAIEPGRARMRALGTFAAPAANEPDAVVEAALYFVEGRFELKPAAEIAEVIWLDPTAIADVQLAPLTRNAVLPLLPGIDNTADRAGAQAP